MKRFQAASPLLLPLLLALFALPPLRGDDAWMEAAAAFQRGERASSWRILQNGLGQNPKDPLLLYEQGRLLLVAGRSERGRSHFADCRKRFPDVPAFWRGEAMALLRLGKGDESRALLRSALQRFGDETSLLNALAGAVLAGGDRQEALSLLKRIREISPDYPLLTENEALVTK